MAGDRWKQHGVIIDLAIIFCAVIIAVIALLTIAAQNIDLENLAKGDLNTFRIETFEGVPHTAYSMKDIKSLVDKRSNNDLRLKRILWLGNSQLHYINQIQAGDHLSPYWLRQSWKRTDPIEPLGCSLPNANLQEQLIISNYVLSRLRVDALMVELVFDDLREDGLRDDFSEILNPETIAQMANASVVIDTILRTYSQVNTKLDGGNDVLHGTIQKPIETWLNSKLSSTWELWAERPRIEGKLLLSLYNLRNWTFGINPTTVRKMIPVRYELNMNALREMLDNMNRRGVPVLLYIAPIRQDKSLPYDAADYARWKGEVDAMARKFSARLVNIEGLVPGGHWGSYIGNDIDFMHFQGTGHRLVAEALLPHVEEMLMGGTR